MWDSYLPFCKACTLPFQLTASLIFFVCLLFICLFVFNFLLPYFFYQLLEVYTQQFRNRVSCFLLLFGPLYCLKDKLDSQLLFPLPSFKIISFLFTSIFILELHFLFHLWHGFELQTLLFMTSSSWHHHRHHSSCMFDPVRSVSPCCWECGGVPYPHISSLGWDMFSETHRQPYVCMPQTFPLCNSIAVTAIRCRASGLSLCLVWCYRILESWYAPCLTYRLRRLDP